MLNTRLYVITNIALIVWKRCRRYNMTDNEKEMVATIKLSLLRAIVDLNEETLLNLVKKVLEESENKWIPVSERLPEENGFYLATCDGEICGENEPFTGLAEYENGKWVDDEEDYQCVLAWMPLPEPYKAESEE
jgi:hypothetical protein